MPSSPSYRQTSQVLRIPRSDTNSESFILLHVSPVGSSSSASLDLELTATEGENPYTGSRAVRQNQLTKLRAKNYKGEDEEWVAILSAVLLLKKLEDSDVEVMKGLEIVGSINEDDNLIITIRKDIGGIMQRLGTISMWQNEDTEIELFQWAGIAAKSARAAEDEVASLSNKYRSQGETLKKLNQQLEDLIKAKVEHENALLEKFVELLNTKKLKIRDQQRLLDAVKVDSSAAIQNRPAGDFTTTASRSRKRKAATPESSGADEAELEKGDTGDESLGVEDATTPERTDEEETEDEDVDDHPGPRPPVPQPRTRGGDIPRAGSREAVAQKGKVSSLPPPRQLPFAKGNALSIAKVEINKRHNNDDGDGNDDETGESDDDEL
ncbi:hypothetical protein FGG08_003692 [Glutinoglossum americanum]|uniref:Uncharacterized protein n=1 Tax=Glutinoglossum americanum TaxID=1670608 RepID=A0A9P8HXU4_9PEZI|nr:hypothetical protein FGG08_003692 [Glutinoglossum americanum]